MTADAAQRRPTRGLCILLSRSLNGGKLEGLIREITIRPNCWTLSAFLISSTFSAGVAQPAALQPGQHPPAALLSFAAALSNGPAFQSGGLKLVVVTASGTGDTVTLSLMLQNTGKDDRLVAVMGDSHGVNNGTTFSVDAISGLTSRNPAANDFHDVTTKCLTGPEARLPVQEFTLVGAGNAVPFSMSFHKTGGNGDLDKKQSFGFSMTLASIKDSQETASDGSDPLQAPRKSDDSSPNRCRAGLDLFR